MKLIMESWRKYSKEVIEEKFKGSKYATSRAAGLNPTIKGREDPRGRGEMGPTDIVSKAILDMLSVYSQPDQNKRMPGPGQDHLVTSANLFGSAFRSRLLMGPDYTTTQTDYRSYKGVENNPISQEAMESTLNYRPGEAAKFDFFDFVLLVMEKQKLLRSTKRGDTPTNSKWKMTAMGVRKFKDLFDKEKEAYGDPNTSPDFKGVRQLGRSYTGDHVATDRQLSKPGQISKTFERTRFEE